MVRSGVAGALLLGGCASQAPRSALDPAGPQALHIEQLWWLMFGVCSVVFVLVIIGLVIALTRHQDVPDKHEPPPEAGRRTVHIIAGLVGVTAVILLVFLVASIVTDRRLLALEQSEALTIEVTGRQWWWDIRYEHEDPSQTFHTANEIHLPVGQPVRLILRSADVIHSFWVPSLHGKRDLVPGHENDLWIQADEPGIYEGQCAEFCGHQHAQMRLLVVAQPPEEFEAWRQRTLQPAREPTTDAQIRGREVFLGSTCIMCHRIRGTLAGGFTAPDLTHVASRRTLGAVVLPNTRGHLAGWISDPQRIKPGNKMPPHAFAPDDLHALLDYLTSLE